ncbi:hypothetical protein CRU96_06935 [Malaciobacter halophilus]|nr:hypothetical protein [Malaciobacter halophilus]RYA23607.1 hypothetical protein CRU96_06935 [Malaciobacter halophilus]
MKINFTNNQDIYLFNNKNKENKEINTVEKSTLKNHTNNSLNNLLIIPTNSIENVSTENFFKLKNEIDETEENIKNDKKKVEKSKSSDELGPLEMLYKKLQELQKQIAQLMSKMAEASEEEIKVLIEKVSGLTAQVSNINAQIQKVLEKSRSK